MTALQSIIKEAKSLRAKFPKRFKKWTDYVKQASAIYATKHKGKSPVGNKKIAKKSISKKPTEKVILKKVHSAKTTSKNLFNKLDKLDEAQHKHMMGKMGAINKIALDHYKQVLNKIENIEKQINGYSILVKNKSYSLKSRKQVKSFLLNLKRYLKELKTQKTELKKLL